MSKEQVSQNTEEQETAKQDQETPSGEGVIEISWEDISDIVSVRDHFERQREDFSHRLLSFERFKSRVLSDLDSMEERMYLMAGELRHKNNIPDGLQYELKLPTAEGEKAYFIRKDV